MSKFSLKCFHKNCVSQSRFEAEEPSPHKHPAMNSRVFWRSPRTGTKCITSSAASPSCLPILKSDKRVTVNVAATNINTSQSDRWPIVSCWSYASTLPILSMSPFIILHSSFYVAGGESQLPNRDRCQWVFFRFNVVVVIGHDDIEMWTKSSTTRATRPSDWNLKSLS